ncbi:hypothetical protein DLE60_01860 [Micromonospora globispora]|uniref:Flp family type IVb pilin n=1 Tax=Micromonospora globispora TaxID=1450148 RepID=A0A317KHM8_9ACTN|nr:Flp family type IVb pilin [Micromonospora globispora]PWU51967.1 hypothetical protein DLJ46_03950 [Micromonospora globispora]PWU62159.1 hypothetical protein DLE60_01860 [Micromonospora globispora]
MNEFIFRIMAWVKSQDRGASAVEYALVLALITGLLILGITLIGGNVQGRLEGACTKFGITCK